MAKVFKPGKWEADKIKQRMNERLEEEKKKRMKEVQGQQDLSQWTRIPKTETKQEQQWQIETRMNQS